MQRPQIPTPALVRHYIRRFDEGRDGLIDKALLDLFRAFPENVRLEHILLKVLGLNALHSTGIIAVQPVARHILKLDIDARLAQSYAGTGRRDRRDADHGRKDQTLLLVCDEIL